MPLQRVHPREEVPAVFTERDFERVRLREVTVGAMVPINTLWTLDPSGD
jgi:hypothetical protein